VPPGYVTTGLFDYRNWVAKAGAILDLPEPPTAIFAGCDEIALGVLEAAPRLAAGETIGAHHVEFATTLVVRGDSATGVRSVTSEGAGRTAPDLQEGAGTFGLGSRSMFNRNGTPERASMATGDSGRVAGRFLPSICGVAPRCRGLGPGNSRAVSRP